MSKSLGKHVLKYATLRRLIKKNPRPLCDEGIALIERLHGEGVEQVTFDELWEIVKRFNREECKRGRGGRVIYVHIHLVMLAEQLKGTAPTLAARLYNFYHQPEIMNYQELRL